MRGSAPASATSERSEPGGHERPPGPALTAGLAGVVLAVAYLLAPPPGTDLSAQVARADFVRAYGFTPVDLRWYGGTVQYGYSVVSSPVMALLGPRLTGALALVGSSVALAVLLHRCGARRPLLGGVLGAACFAGNLVSGRVTFALGVAFGLGALVALTAPARWVRLAVGGGGAALAATLLSRNAASAATDDAQHQWAFVIDLRRCDGCENCKTQNFHGSSDGNRTLSVYQRVVRFTRPDECVKSAFAPALPGRACRMN